MPARNPRPDHAPATNRLSSSGVQQKLFSSGVQCSSPATSRDPPRGACGTHAWPQPKTRARDALQRAPQSIRTSKHAQPASTPTARVDRRTRSAEAAAAERYCRTGSGQDADANQEGPQMQAKATQVSVRTPVAWVPGIRELGRSTKMKITMEMKTQKKKQRQGKDRAALRHRCPPLG